MIYSKKYLIGVFDGTPNTNGAILEIKHWEDGYNKVPIYGSADSFASSNHCDVVGVAELHFNESTGELTASNILMYDEAISNTYGKYLISCGYTSQAHGYQVSALAISDSPARDGVDQLKNSTH